MAAGPDTVARDEFTHRFLGTCMLVRLVAVLASLLGLVGDVVTLPVLLCTVAITVSSLCVLLSADVASFLACHPLACVIDVLLSLAVIAVLGAESPLVLATLSTSLVVGYLFGHWTAMLCTVILLAGYAIVVMLGEQSTDRFMLTLGVPVLYVGLVMVGGALRRAHCAEVAAAHELAEVRSVAAAADERARLAREMHDSVGKTLHGIALGAEALPALVEREPTAAGSYARELSDGARRAAQEARQLLVRLRADQPDRPLVEVLRERCATWAEAAGIACEFRSSGVADLPVDTRYEVLAIFSEALENVRRHARAESVAVALIGEAGGAARLEVRDDGAGFVPRPECDSPPGHFGLTGMAERARQAGLDLVVDSRPGAGTTVVVSVGPRSSTAAPTDLGELTHA